jgi:hypothetical protein
VYPLNFSVTRLCACGGISKHPCTHFTSLLPGFASPEEFQNTPVYPLQFSVTRLCISGGFSKHTRVSTSLLCYPALHLRRNFKSHPSTHFISLLPGFASPEAFQNIRIPTSVFCYPALRLRRNFKSLPSTHFISLLPGFPSPEEFQNIRIPTSVLCYPALRLRRNFKTHPSTHLSSLSDILQFSTSLVTFRNYKNRLSIIYVIVNICRKTVTYIHFFIFYFQLRTAAIKAYCAI